MPSGQMTTTLSLCNNGPSLWRLELSSGLRFDEIESILHMWHSPQSVNFLLFNMFLPKTSRLTLIFLIVGFGLQSIWSQQIPKSFFSSMKIRNIGPAGTSGRVTSIDALQSNPDIIYIGTASGGLWRTTSGGTTWEPLFDDQPVSSIGAVALNQRNPSIIWAGTGEGNPRNSHNSGAGIYKSIDGGRTWQLKGLKDSKTIHRILLHPDNPDIVYVAALGSAWGPNEERGVFKTSDGGDSWQKVLYVNDSSGCADLVIDPTNPDKLIAAMYQYIRRPWFFTSGGSGSGLYVTHDGGQTWQKRTEKDGLPKGNLGRMGLSICHSRPNVIYALIESSKTALYRSDNGGFNWQKISDKNIGNRPFYYADIYVDPKNENRIYNLHSLVTLSEDGGKTFSTLLPYSGVHPDHHAFWIHPDDPDLIMDGNDGGINISRDRGKNWRFIENLPLGQFYHINYDMETPYNVYGGMQDNGTWVGPSQVWQRGGIRNEHWQEVLFGDGFDAMPNAKDSRYGYAMYQGGNLYTFDRETGRTEYIQPVHPKGTQLRFNWNAALAQDPFFEHTIYFGSQFVHKSTDAGKSWTVISPDLTTNDTTKQKQVESGGLTIDATKAENYTSILCIEPSPVQKGIIWAGTDDGNLQLTTNNGQTWQNLIDRLPNAPKGAWIPQIVASPHSAKEAFVVINDYRRNNWSKYLYHTTDLGKTWNEIAGKNDSIDGFCLSVFQDPQVPELLFLGTDRGLFLSIDYGKKWQKWRNGFPSVPVSDLKVHPREHDLVIGTFGRAAWILDNIIPLRALAKKHKSEYNLPLAIFHPQDAWLAERKSASGVRFTADAHYSGTNKHPGALLYFWKGIPTDSCTESDKVAFTILSGKRDTIRTFTVKPDSGLNRTHWNLRQNGVRYPSWSSPKKNADIPSGSRVPPGRYKVFISYGSDIDSTMIRVNPDPRIKVSSSDIQKVDSLRKTFEGIVSECTAGFNQLKDAKSAIERVNRRMELVDNDSIKTEIENTGKTLKDSIDNIMDVFLLAEDFKGYDHVTVRLVSRLYTTGSYLETCRTGISKNAINYLTETERQSKVVLKRIDAFFSDQWKEYQNNVSKVDMPVFKD